MKYFFFVIFVTFFALSSFSFAQKGRPYTHCHTDGCDSCQTSTTSTFNFQYMGCNVEVSYKCKKCFCPDPVVNIDIEYLKVELNCTNLICWLHPGPSPCINNPLNTDNYKEFEDAAYAYLITDMFDNELYQPPCPEVKKYRYFHVAPCIQVCSYYIEHEGPTPGYGMMYVNHPCPEPVSGCCGTEYSICLLNGQKQVTTMSFFEIVECNGVLGGVGICEHQVNDSFDIGSETWKVISVSVTTCVPVCEEE